MDSDVCDDSDHNYANSRECLKIKKLVSNVQNDSSLRFWKGESLTYADSH